MPNYKGLIELFKKQEPVATVEEFRSWFSEHPEADGNTLIDQSDLDTLSSRILPSNFNTPLILAIKLRLPPIVEFLLKEKNANPNFSHTESDIAPTSEERDPKQEDDRSPLMLAAVIPNLEIVKLLTEHGAEVNPSQPVHFSSSPLIQASSNPLQDEKQAEIVTILCKNGADLSHRDESGMTALGRAVHNSLPLVVKALLKFGADPNEKFCESYRYSTMYEDCETTFDAAKCKVETDVVCKENPLQVLKVLESHLKSKQQSTTSEQGPREFIDKGAAAAVVMPPPAGITSPSSQAAARG